jgi:hypothetical protein
MKALLASAALAMIAFAVPASAQAVWNQIPATDPTSTVVSQDFESAYNAYDDIVVDDFTLGSSTQLTSFDALLLGFNGGQSHIGNVTNFTINIYSSLAAATSNLTGDIFSYTAPSGAVTITSPFSTDTKLVHIPFLTTLAAGHYYIGLTSQLNFKSFGEMGVATYGTGDGYMVNPGGGFGSTPTLLSSMGAGGNAAYRLNSATAATSAVPEPATWGMMVVGVGMLGGVLRNQRRKALAAA